ncbi:hypothetical protein WBG06_05740 [Nocardioides sp. CCNWLW239]|uniref:hypothetical protein n=1 Tax=Nocardioides sp. CCNWLW239 TaxID=3128902 RepID=UPI003019478D
MHETATSPSPTCFGPWRDLWDRRRIGSGLVLAVTLALSTIAVPSSADAAPQPTTTAATAVPAGDDDPLDPAAWTLGNGSAPAGSSAANWVKLSSGNGYMNADDTPSGAGSQLQQSVTGVTPGSTLSVTVHWNHGIPNPGDAMQLTLSYAGVNYAAWQTPYGVGSSKVVVANGATVAPATGSAEKTAATYQVTFPDNVPQSGVMRFAMTAITNKVSPGDDFRITNLSMHSPPVPVPEEGLPEQRRKAVLRNGSLKNPWGVTGRSPLFQDNLDVEVQAFGEDTANDIMYVGGNFTTVQRDKDGTDAATQQFLAAFDSVTGEWIDTFRPDLDGQVKAIEVLPGGRLAVGGEFANVDGAPHEGFVVLDTATGKVHPDFTTLLVNHISIETVSVWDFVTDDGWLYLAGKFTHATAPGSTREIYSRNLMRMSLDDLTPDRTFTADLNGGAVDLDIHNGRLYAAGTFSQNKGNPAFRALAIDLDDYSQIPWTIHTSYGTAVLNTRQYGVVATDTSVWLTGAEHLHAAYDATDLSLKQTWMQYSGGDGQTIATNGDTVFAGCHCWDYTYEGARKWGDKGSNYAEISAIGAYDAVGTTIQRSPKVWDPVFSSRRGDGAWASHIDERGTLWVGGDFTHARPDGWTTGNRWTGGFVRFEQDGDATAPDVPTRLTVVTDGSWDALSWDPTGEDGLTYQVFRIGSGDMVAETTDTAIAVPAAPEGTRYLVRAIDTAGNISATSDPAVAQPGEIPAGLVHEGEPVRPTQVIAPRTSWTYSYDAGRPDGWPAVTSLASTGAAPLGWGTQDVATTFPAAADGTRPLATYYARSFELPADAPHQELVITVRLDDGAAVYVNGREVLRENLPDGDLTDRTYATTSVSGAAAPANTSTVRIPVSDLTTGTNTITAETHANWSKAPSSTFDLEAVLQ